MPVLPKEERYAFSDPEHDPWLQFPHVMKELHLTYPDYDLVWDRQKERWLSIVWLSWPAKTELAPLYFVEGERGIYRDPDIAFVEKLRETDIANQQGDITAFLDRLDRDFDDYTEQRQAELEAAGEDVTKRWMEYVHKNSSTTSSVAGWRQRHLVGVRDAAQASARSHGEVNANHS